MKIGKNQIRLTDIAPFVLSASILMPVKFFNIILIFFIITLVAKRGFMNRFRQSRKVSFIYILNIPFFIFLTSVIYSTNSDYKTLETTLGLLAFPWLIYWSNFENNDKKSLENGLLYSCVVFGLICFSYAIYQNIYIPDDGIPKNWGSKDTQTFNNLNSNSIVNWNYFSYTSFVEIVKLHPTYFSTFLFFCLIVLAKRLETGKNKLRLMLISLFILTLIFLISARVTLILLPIVVLFYIVFKLLWGQISIKYVIISSIVFISAGIFLYSLPSTQFRLQKMNSVFDHSFENEAELVTDGIKHRIYLWKTSYQLIKHKPLLGYGIRDDKDALMSAYEEDGVLTSYFNTHNQYLRISLANGAIGLLLFLAFLFYCFIVAMKNKDLEYVLFLVLCSGVFMTENFLSTHKGVLFFSIMNSVFMVLNKKNTVEKIS